MQIFPLLPGESSPSDRRWPRCTERISTACLSVHSCLPPYAQLCVCVHMCVSPHVGSGLLRLCPTRQAVTGRQDNQELG